MEAGRGKAPGTALDCYYEVTVFSGGYYSPRSYHSKNELRRDFREWLDGEAPTTFIVEWTDHEGNLQQRPFDTLEDAQLEAAGLEEQFDHIAIITEVEV